MNKHNHPEREKGSPLQGLKDNIREIKRTFNDLKEISDMVGLTRLAKFMSRQLDSMLEGIDDELTELINTAKKDKWLPKSWKAIGGFVEYVTRPFRSKR